MTPLLTSTTLRLKAFSDDTRGVTAVLFALLAVPLICLVMIAIDFSRAEDARAAITHAADTAAENGAKMLGAPHDQIEDAVRGYMRTNLPAGRQDLDYVLTFASDDTWLSITVDTSIPSTMFGIAGIKSMTINVASTAKRPEPVNVQRPHHGVAPDIAGLPPLDQEPNERELREAQAQVREMLHELKRSGGAEEVDRLMRALADER